MESSEDPETLRVRYDTLTALLMAGLQLAEIRKVIRVMLVLGCLTLPAQAEISRPLSHVLFWSGHVADYTTTRLAIAHGAREGNPLAPGGALTSAGFLVGFGALNETLAHLAERDGHPTMARRWRLIVGGMHFTAAVWNIHVLRGQLRKGR